jgi:hypothetical protein
MKTPLNEKQQEEFEANFYRLMGIPRDGRVDPAELSDLFDDEGGDTASLFPSGPPTPPIKILTLH